MAYDKVTSLKADNKQLWRKAARLVQLNLRFCILLLMLLVTVIVFVRLNRSLQHQPKHLTLHQYVRNFFSDPYSHHLKIVQNSSEEHDESFDYEEFDLIWSNEIIELFQDQLGVVLDDEPKSSQCQPDEEFILSALPGPNDESLNDNVWQYFSLIALESQTIQNDGSRKLSLKAFVTEQMRVVLDQIFEGLSLQMLSNLSTKCYNLKHARIIGNKSPINLKEITPSTAPLLLDPKAKRTAEIAQLFASKIRPYFRINREIMIEVDQEFIVTKTIQEVETDRDADVNFVGVYITGDDKLPIEYYERAMTFHRKNERTIFMVICDTEMLSFCHESFDGKGSVGDVRILRKSTDTFDFGLMVSCNSTIVSNDFGLLHALINGGDTTVRKPLPTEDPEYYTPFLISEQMANFYAIE